MSKRPGTVDVVTEVGYCNFCGRTRNLRNEQHRLGNMVRTIVTCETCHRTLTTSMGVATDEPQPEPVAAEAKKPDAAAKSKPAPKATTKPAARKTAKPAPAKPKPAAKPAAKAKPKAAAKAPAKSKSSRSTTTKRAAR